MSENGQTAFKNLTEFAARFEMVCDHFVTCIIVLKAS